MRSQLEACPLCAGEAKLKTVAKPFMHGNVDCPACHLYIQWNHDPKAAIERWNTRKECDK